MATKVRLTRKRMEALNSALSLDDLLYEKFRRLHQDLAERERKFELRKMIVEVVQRRGQNPAADYYLPILKLEQLPNGVRVICGLDRKD